MFITKKIKGVVTGLVAGAGVVAVSASNALALPIFAVDQTTIDLVKADMVSWGTAVIALGLALLAYRYVRKVIGR